MATATRTLPGAMLSGGKLSADAFRAADSEATARGFEYVAPRHVPARFGNVATAWRHKSIQSRWLIIHANGQITLTERA